MLSDMVVYDESRNSDPMTKLTWPLKCSVCGSVMLIEDPHNLECLQIIRARCPKNCRGSDIVQERRHPCLPPIREFDWKTEAKKDQHAHNHTAFFLERTFTCEVCWKTVTGKFHPASKTCSKECQKRLNQITAHKRWLRIKKEREGKN